MKNKMCLLLILLLIAMVSYSQNPPGIGDRNDDSIIVNTGGNYILLPDIDDNDPADQMISFTYSSSNNAVLSIDSVAYNIGERMAVLYVQEYGELGTVTINIEIDDGDGTDNTSFDVHIVNYDKYGVNYEVHDIIFWQEENPFGLTPLWDSLIERPVAPVDQINWSNIPLTVSGDCNAEWCDGHDFNTTIMEGYVIPPITGEYTFYQIHQDGDAMWLSTDASYDNVKQIMYEAGEEGTPIGSATDVENEWKSEPVTLTANKVYAFYTVQWNIHFENDTLMWEGPGIDKQIIDSEHLFYVYDTIKPGTPAGLELFKKGDDEITVKWTASMDNQMLKGYNVYLNGTKVSVTEKNTTSYRITDLNPNSIYSIVVTATDDMGNESLLSNVLNVETYASDDNPPDPPTNVALAESSGLALKITWDDASDNETEIRGYNLYLDGEKYNTSLIYGTELIIENLLPETMYEIDVRSVDAGYNESGQSDILEARTVKFDVGDNLGVKNGRLTVNMEAISWNDGIGMNMPHPYKDQMPDKLMEKHFEEMNVGALRLMWDWDLADECDKWSAPDHFMGPDIEYSIGDFMHLCNKNNAYTTIAITMQEDGWFVNDPQSFANIIEYFAGPDDSTWGAERAAEGYSGSLLEDSPGLIIEYGNEVWGGLAHCASLGENLAEYAEWCRNMDTIIKSSPYYDSTKIFTCYSGRNPRVEFSYGQNEPLYRGDNGQVDWIALSGYMGGNFDYDPGIDPAETELGFLKNGIETVLDKLDGLIDQNQQMLTMAGEIKPIWFYEGNFTTSSYFGRFGQGIIFTDYLATGMERGLAIPILYSLYQGQWKNIVPSLDYKKLCLFHTATFFNNHCIGDILKTSFSSTNTISNAAGDVLDADPVSCHAYHNNGYYSVLLINRDFENDFYVQLNLPDTLTFTGTATKYEFTSDHYSSYETSIDTSEINVTDSMMIKVPKYGMVLITFQGADQGFEKLPLGYWNDYVKVTDLTITSADNTNMITEARGRLRLNAEISPRDAFATSALWELLDDDIGTRLSGNTLIAPDLEGVADTVYVKATADGVSDTYMVIIDIPVGINDVNDDHAVLVYPNPANDNLNLVLEPSSSAFVLIKNVQGKSVLSKKINGESIQLSTAGFKPGIYFIRVALENGTIINRKLVKQ